ncbi:MAG: DMT family transporter [Alphaproteobacteria bacterium]
MTKVLHSPPPDNAKIGILCVLASTFFFNILNVAAKWLSDDYSIVEITFFRNAFAFLPCLIVVLAGPGLHSLRTGRLGLHMLRGLGGLASTLLAFTSYSLMPIADAVAISFASPLFLTALSVPLLGEKVGVHRWSAVVIGFLGILVMAKPSGMGQNLGFFVALAGTVLGSFILVSVRRLGRTEAAITIIFYQALIGTVAAALLLPLGWRTPTLVDFAVFTGLGLVGVMGHFFQTQGFRYAAAAVVGPFNYAGLIWACLFGYAIWGDIPGPGTLLGGLIVIASGLYILYRETRRRLPTVSAAPP